MRKKWVSATFSELVTEFTLSKGVNSIADRCLKDCQEKLAHPDVTIETFNIFYLTLTKTDEIGHPSFRVYGNMIAFIDLDMFG